ncbi:MAG: hypothetical protein IPO92_18305 [Saprospiraceae bacterium]|nr:hypothetical protein [Saprospiraceae bacterium]
MKTNKQNKNIKNPKPDDQETIKPKKKLAINDSKVNIKSKKFWEELYDDEGEELEKYLR